MGIIYRFWLAITSCKLVIKLNFNKILEIAILDNEPFACMYALLLLGLGCNGYSWSSLIAKPKKCFQINLIPLLRHFVYY